MRVLLVSWEYPPVIEGGLARHVRKLSEHLARHGVEVHVLSRSGGHLPAREVRHGVIVHRVREPEFPRDVGAFVRWVDRMNADMFELGVGLCGEQDGFDLVHSHDWLVADVAQRLAGHLGCPWLVTVHATEFGRHQGWVSSYPQSHIHAVERHMVAAADRVITCSHYMRGHVATVLGAPLGQTTVIQNAVDPRDLEPVFDLDSLRVRFAQPHQRLVLLVGRLVYEKGFHLALDALAQVVQTLAGVCFVVAGSGTAEAELKEQARRLGLMRHGSFLGWVGDDMLHSLYRVAEVTIVPSIYEPFGLVALEAMACGCLCIVADTGGLREVVPANGTVGLRFRSRDSEALGEVLGRILTNDRDRAKLVAEAREHVLAFDWSEVARRTHEVYLEVSMAASAPRATQPF